MPNLPAAASATTAQARHATQLRTRSAGSGRLTASVTRFHANGKGGRTPGVAEGRYAVAPPHTTVPLCVTPAAITPER